MALPKEVVDILNRVRRKNGRPLLGESMVGPPAGNPRRCCGTPKGKKPHAVWCSNYRKSHTSV